MLKFYWVWGYNRNVKNGLEGQQFKIKLRLVFWSILRSSHPQMTKCCPRLEEGQYTFSNQLTNLETIILWIFGKLCNLSQWSHNCTPSTWIYSNQLNIPVVDVKDMLCLSLVQNFISNGNHLHIGINNINMFRYVVPKPWRWQMSSCVVHGPVPL